MKAGPGLKDDPDGTFVIYQKLSNIPPLIPVGYSEFSKTVGDAVGMIVGNVG
jgi:hypothetical protein